MQAIIDRAVIRWKTGPLRFDIPVREKNLVHALGNGKSLEVKILTEKEFRELERANVLAALNESQWKIRGPGGAAELLGLPPTTLASRLGRLGLRRPIGHSEFT